MHYPLQGRGVFFFCDAAGAYSCMSLAYMLEKETGISQSLYSNQERYSTNQFGLDVRKIEDPAVVNFSDFDFVFTGTSHPARSEGFELRAIRGALNKRTYSFVDHWTNFAMRFTLNNELIFPDEIWVLDELAKAKAIEDGVPESKLVICDNPYHYFLKNYWRSKFQGREYLQQLIKLSPGQKKVLLYAPDPISLSKGQEGSAYNEFSFFRVLLDLLNENFGDEVLLIAKIHPIQEVDQYVEVLKLSENRIPTYILKEADANELLNVSDLVIGFYSNILLEAECLGKKVLRFVPSEDSDLFAHIKVGELIRSREQLLQQLKTKL